MDSTKSTYSKHNGWHCLNKGGITKGCIDSNLFGHTVKNFGWLY